MNKLLGVIELNLLAHMELGLLNVKSSGLDVVSTGTGDELGLARIVGGLPLGGADLIFRRLVLREGGGSVVHIWGRRDHTFLDKG